MKVGFVLNQEQGAIPNVARPIWEQLRGYDPLWLPAGKTNNADLVADINTCDVVHFFYAGTMRHLCEKYTVLPPRVVTIHHLATEWNDNYEVALTVGRPTIIHVVDRYTQNLLGRLGYPNTKFIPQALTRSAFPLCDSPETFTLGYVGVDDPRKRIGVAKEIANELGVPFIHHDSATWVSHKELLAVYSQISCYVVASFLEGGPLPAQEAFRCGRPILSTPVGRMTDIVEPGVNGEIFNGSVADGVAYANKIRAEYLHYRAGVRRSHDAVPYPEDVVEDYLTLYQETA